MKAFKLDWIPIQGEFDIKADSIIFIGKEATFKNMVTNQDEIGDAYGLLISDKKIGEGEISTEIQFDKIDTKTTCQIVFYYNSSNNDHLTAGICGGNAMFSLNTSISGKITIPIFNGDHNNLKAKQDYKLRVRIEGSKIFLEIDNVEVLSYLLPYNYQEGSVGLLFLSQFKVVVKKYSINKKNPYIFMIMKLDDKYTEIYEEAIKDVSKDRNYNFEIINADEIYGPGIIISDIIDKINKSKIIIAEVTLENANVFYEVGYAQALKKPTILIAEKGRVLPFDINAFRVLFYENTIAGKRRLQEGLKKHIEAILNQQITI